MPATRWHAPCSLVDIDRERPLEPTPELLLRYTRPGPRYTSYPTAPAWQADFPESGWTEGLRQLEGPVSVYVHVPFCEEQCSYCACNMVVARRREAGTRYLNALEKQVRALPLSAEQLDVDRLHLGGGTPTWLDPEELERLFDILALRFRTLPDARVSVEADPAVTRVEHLEALARRGARRLSLGVQSFDEVVLTAVNRPQRYEDIRGMVDEARWLGFERLNLDLMYGLPHQTPERFAGTLAKALSLRPDRFAVFGYAHVPWIKSHQKKLDVAGLPGPAARANMYLQARATLLGAGYEAVGIDHFALPDDPLAAARRAGTLGRDFMGYTTRAGGAMIGLGMSAISDLGDRYVQQQAKLSRWWKAAEEGAPLVEKGALLTPEDQLRRAVITGLMCNLRLPYAPIERQFGVDFKRHFKEELDGLSDMEDAGLVERGDDWLAITDSGQLFVRNAAMRFDAYLKGRGEKPRFSQTV